MENDTLKRTISPRFYRNHNILWSFLVLFGLLGVPQIFEKGVTKPMIVGVVILCIYIVFSLLCHLNTYVLIDKEKYLINKVALGRGFMAKISHIQRIEREHEFVFKSMGYHMIVYFMDKTGQEQARSLKEFIYDIKDIKALLSSLKSINPSIHLHPQYQALIDGKIKHEEDFKKLRLEEKVK